MAAAMTEYAKRGLARQDPMLPAWENWHPYPDLKYVIPWHCPVCGQLVAETAIHGVGGQHLPGSLLAATDSPVRVHEAEEDDVPFWGPSRHEIRGKQPRHSIDPLARRMESKRRHEAARRRGDLPSQWPELEHGPIEYSTFDTICPYCPRRLRIEVPPA
jgi:hypothetical protein